MTDYSSESDNHHANKGNGRHVGRKINQLTSTLQDTNRNLKSLDRLLETYRVVGDKQSTAMDKLREDVQKIRAGGRSSVTGNAPFDSRAHGDVAYIPGGRDARLRRASSPTEIYASDDLAVLQRQGLHGGLNGIRRSGSVRFLASGAAVASPSEIHELHQSVRDMTTEQSRIREELEKLGKVKDGSPLKDYLDHVRSAHPTVPLDHSSEGQKTVHTTVDRRLQDAQESLKAERRALDRRNTDLGQLSSTLKTALDRFQRDTPVPSAGAVKSVDTVEQMLRSRITQLESAKSSAESELESLRRRAGQEEGSRTTLHRQLEECQGQLVTSERDRSKLKTKVTELEGKLERSRKKMEELDNERGERGRLDSDLGELRTRLASSVPSSDLEDMRRQRDKLARQKDQLSEQTTRQTHDLESKERQISRLLDELREAQSRADSAEHSQEEGKSATAAVERELRETRRREDVALERAERAERALQEAQVAIETARCNNNDTVKQWKSRCQRYQKETQRLNDVVSEQTQRAEQMGREADQLRAQVTSLHGQSDILRREMEALLAVHSTSEEQARRRDEENEALRLRQYEIEAQMESAEKMAEKHKFETEALGHELNAVREERARLEEKLSAAEVAHLSASDQLTRTGQDLKEVAQQKAALMTSYTEASVQLQDHKSQQEQIKDLNRQLEQMRRDEQKTVRDLQKRLHKAEQDGTVQVSELRNLLEEEVKGARVLSGRCERQAAEITRLHDEHWRTQQELDQTRTKMIKTKEKMRLKSETTVNENSRIRQQEDDMTKVRAKLERIVIERDQICRRVTTDVDSLVEVVANSTATGGSTSDAAMLRETVLLPAGLDMCARSQESGIEPSRWLADLQPKLAWLRAEVSRWTGCLKDARDRATEAEEFMAKVEAAQSERDKVEEKLMGDLKTLETSLEDEKAEKLRQSLDLMDAGEAMDVLRLREETDRENMLMQQRYEELQRSLDCVRHDLHSIDRPSSRHSSPSPNPRSALRRTPNHYASADDVVDKRERHRSGKVDFVW